MNKYLLLATLLVSSTSFAGSVTSTYVYEGQPGYSYGGQLLGPGFAPGLATASDANPGTNIANPGRRRVAGAAIIMQSEGLIHEDSIPYYALNKEPYYNEPENSIFVGTITPIPYDAHALPEPALEKHTIIEQTTTTETNIIKE
jgi:hypothetical protein